MVVDCKTCPLRKAEIFDEMTEEEIQFMGTFKVGETKLDKGAQILMEGARSPQLFTVLRGMGLRYKVLPNGRRHVVNFILPGDFLGLQSGVMGEMKHSAEATTTMTLCVFNRSDLWTMYRQQPQRAYDLTWLASVEEHFLGEALASVGQMDAIQRICWGLVRFFDRCDGLGLVSDEACAFPYRQQDLADAVGLSLVHTNKTLQKLRDRQVLSWQDGTLRFLEMDVARQLAMMEEDSAETRPLI
ncbi:cyclic nucleotide-binding domain-containing protein [Alphaproteobacteria bacterium GH1-50]|uniref:Cyclic nucleotide-binding domain-containing protein n=1 Tax=Kangsaoukella pontilimi TaxID=2691042 RepID=A0A7C9IPJ1_9RHOB|nr:cyclic nucleotide-binding domain-containing protein [Kangsaoukella pontilimi]MXQ08110.1 cyclic nucleotide-binding domain-containing protein [Kangsaoukella pontilimi]